MKINIFKMEDTTMVSKNKSLVSVFSPLTTSSQQNLFGSNFERDLFKSPFEDLMDDFLDGFFKNPQSVKDVLKSKSIYPKADVILENDKIIYRLSVPGIDKKDLRVIYETDESSLTVKYEKNEEDNTKNNNSKFLLKELRSSSFIRKFYIDKNIVNFDENGLQSKLENGILEIIIPIIVDNKEKGSVRVINIE